MKLKEFVWKDAKHKYANGFFLYVGKIQVAGYTYDGITRGNSWVGTIHLPSLKRDLAFKGNDEKQIRTDIERVVQGWFDETLEQGD